MRLLGYRFSTQMRHPKKILFSFISALCMLTHNAIMICLDQLHIALAFCLIVSFIIVTIIGYLGHSTIVFREQLSIKKFLKYISGMLGGIVISVPIIYFWKCGISLPMWIAAPIASICTLMINFFLVRWAISAKAP